MTDQLFQNKTTEQKLKANQEDLNRFRTANLSCTGMKMRKVRKVRRTFRSFWSDMRIPLKVILALFKTTTFSFYSWKFHALIAELLLWGEDRRSVTRLLGVVGGCKPPPAACSPPAGML